MYIILPKVKDGLSKVVASLTDTELKKSMMQNGHVLYLSILNYQNLLSKIDSREFRVLLKNSVWAKYLINVLPILVTWDQQI